MSPACFPREAGTARVQRDVKRVMEALQVMSLLLKMRKVKALLKVMSLLQEVVTALLKDVFSLLSPLTRTQTTLPQPRLAARTSR